jgi:hypothetical protein
MPSCDIYELQLGACQGEAADAELTHGAVPSVDLNGASTVPEDFGQP